jgi:hypothetical protein
VGEISDLVASCHSDPYEFVCIMFPWGEGELEAFQGPDEWQTKILKGIRDGLLTVGEAIRIAVASGHGIGKSALVAWIVLWAISTMVDTKGVVTANTENQLKTKTWAELAKWHRMCLCGDWFELTATAIYSKLPEREKTWRVDMVPWSEKNTEAFAGLHNKGKRVLLIFDEASAIPEMIWEVADGALTDENTEIIQLAFGNPTRSLGGFKDCFGRFRQRWTTYQIDSRTAAMTNKKVLQEMIEDRGIDSDYVKVRILGQFPSQDESALFSQDAVEAAMNRVHTPREISHAAKVLGVDVARQGGDDSVIAKRQGLAMWPLEAMHIPDSQLVAARVAKAETDWEYVDAIFVDASGGYGAGVIDKLRAMRRTCTEVYFNGKATDPRFFDKRSEMAFDFMNWVGNTEAGGSLAQDNVLKEEMLAFTYTFQGDKFRLCAKDDVKAIIGRSPDKFDACILTFAYPTSPSTHQRQMAIMQQQSAITPKTLNYDPLEV